MWKRQLTCVSSCCDFHVWPWPWTCSKLPHLSRDHALFKIWTKSINPWQLELLMIKQSFFVGFRGYRKWTFLKGREPICTKCGENTAWPSAQPKYINIFDILLRFQTKVESRWAISPKSHFLTPPPVKIMEGWCLWKCSSIHYYKRVVYVTVKVWNRVFCEITTIFSHFVKLLFQSAFNEITKFLRYFM